MRTQPGRFHDGSRLGFTLLELLLTVALLMGLLAAIVFNFGSLQRNSDLDEGGRQFEALVKFAAAQAANSGRLVQFRVGDDSSFDSTSDSGSSANSAEATKTQSASTNAPASSPLAGFVEGPKLRLVWEVDPAAQPGVFSDMLEAASFLASLEERVRVESVKAPGRPSNMATNDLSAVAETASNFSAISFFADGSSDSVEVVLASTNPEDHRRLKIFLDGVTGGIRTEHGVSDDLVPLEWDEDFGSSDSAGEPASEKASERAAPAISSERSAGAGERSDSFSEPPPAEKKPFEDDEP
jgi:type II secretory pathway pseudopilin PulG